MRGFNIALTTTVILSTGCVTNLRPPTIDAAGATAADIEKGRALLQAAAETHGLAKYRESKTIRYEMTDIWQGFLASVANPWPDKEVKARMTYRLRTFDGRATFLAGDEEGRTWGVQAWQTYQLERDGTAKLDDNDDARFILPALQYLLEFPFRGLEAEHIAYGGIAEVNGTKYETVFVTWGSYDAHSEDDQYVAYINPTTKRVEKVAYTVRDFAGFAQGAMHYDDYQSFDGVLIPLKQTVTGAVDDEEDDNLHQVIIDPKSVEIDAVDPKELVVDPKLPPSGDRKPA